MKTEKLHKGEYRITNEKGLIFIVSKQWISGEWVSSLEDWNHPRYEESEMTDDKLKYIKQRIEFF